MDTAALRSWLAKPRLDLVAAVADGIRDHVATLRSRGIDFYGYAILPGEPDDIHDLVAVANNEAGIEVPAADKQYRYYRYGVDEWSHWDSDGFASANALLVEANAQFEAMHSKADGDYMMDEFELAHADALLDAIVRGLEIAKDEGVFGSDNRFLVVWISDSDHKIMTESARRLNSAVVFQDFMQAFC
jgi:hypothetical protein